jgi:hypothetical protein
MKYKLTKGGRLLESTYKGEELKCFKCKLGKFDYIEAGNYLKPVDNGIYWYWCDQRYKERAFMPHETFIFCSRVDCVKARCGKAGIDNNHQDWKIDNFEGFE